MDSNQKKILYVVAGVTTIVISAFLVKTFVLPKCWKSEKEKE
jgi:hypothetical protein